MEKEPKDWCPENVTTGVAANYCGVSKVTVLRWIKKGYLNAYKLPEGQNRIHRNDLMAFIIKYGLPVHKQGERLK